MLDDYLACTVGLQTYAVILCAWASLVVPFTIFDYLDFWPKYRIFKGKLPEGQWWLAAKMSLGNLLLLLPVTTAAGPVLEQLLLPKDEPWTDSWAEVVGKLAVWFVVDDICFYAYHRFLHVNPALYKAFHKPHHVFNHPFPLAAYAVTPVELSFQSMGATLGPLLLWKGTTHRHLLWIFLTLRQWQGIEDHLGYHLPIGSHMLPWVGGTKFHDAHHSINTGNYASIFPVIDRIFGTDIKEKPA